MKNCQIQSFLIPHVFIYQMLNRQQHITEFEECILKSERKIRKNPVVVGVLEKQNVILYLDEATAFFRNHHNAKMTMEILANHPPKVIILQAPDIPNPNELKNTIQLIRKKHPKLKVCAVQSSDFQACYQFTNFNGSPIFPHTGVKSKEQLQKLRKLLDKNPFLMRLYNGPSLIGLINRCREKGLNNLFDFQNLSEVKSYDIISAASKTLEVISFQKDEIIKELCKSSATKQDELANKYNQQQVYESISQNLDDQISSDQDEPKGQNHFNLRRLCTSDAHKFIGGCLIATADPISFAEYFFGEWVSDIQPIGHLLNNNLKQIQNQQHDLKQIRQNPKIKKIEKDAKMNQIMNRDLARVQIPLSKSINSKQHLNEYCKNLNKSMKKKCINPTLLEFALKTLYEQGNDDEFVLKLLVCGIGIYCQVGLSDKYLEVIEQLAKNRCLSYLIADQFFVQSSGLPFSHIIVRDSLLKNIDVDQMLNMVGKTLKQHGDWRVRVLLGKEWKKSFFASIRQHEFLKSQLAQQHLNNPQMQNSSEKFKNP